MIKKPGSAVSKGKARSRVIHRSKLTVFLMWAIHSFINSWLYVNSFFCTYLTYTAMTLATVTMTIFSRKEHIFSVNLQFQKANLSKELSFPTNSIYFSTREFHCYPVNQKISFFASGVLKPSLSATFPEKYFSPIKLCIIKNKPDVAGYKRYEYCVVVSSCGVTVSFWKPSSRGKLVSLVVGTWAWCCGPS